MKSPSMGVGLPRGIHEAVWGIALLLVLGRDPLVGVLALGIPFGAITAKVFAEIIEGQDVVLRIPEGERIDTIRLVGDPTAILAPHAGMVSVWNRMLDAAGDPRAGN